MQKSSPFEQNLDKNPANYAPLTPLQFIERAAYVYPERLAVVHGARRFTWKETYARCRRLASALAKRGIGKGDTVAAMLANTPEMYECHFGVPMTRRRAEHAQHAPGRRRHRLHAEPRRSEGADHRQGVLADHRGSAEEARAQARR